MRVNYVCPDELLQKVDAKCKELSITRTAYINMAVTQKLQQDEMLKNMPALIETFNRAIEESKRVNP